MQSDFSIRALNSLIEMSVTEFICQMLRSHGSHSHHLAFKLQRACITKLWVVLARTLHQFIKLGDRGTFSESYLRRIGYDTAEISSTIHSARREHYGTICITTD